MVQKIFIGNILIISSTIEKALMQKYSYMALKKTKYKVSKNMSKRKVCSHNQLLSTALFTLDNFAFG